MPPKSEDDQATELRRKRAPIWKCNINDRVIGQDSLPSSFQTTGTIRGDYMQVAKAFSAVPHPAFKPRQKLGAKPTKGTVAAVAAAAAAAADKDGATDSVPTGPVEDPFFIVQAIRWDRISSLILGLILPEARVLKVLKFVECRLDLEMLSLLRRGLTGDCSVECLQIEWNPLDKDSLAELQTVRPVTMRMASARGDAPTREAENDDDGDRAGIVLASFIDQDCVLEAVCARACNSCSAQIAVLAATLEKCPWQLRQLNLWENLICDKGAASLAKALDAYRGLEYLGLGRNRITDEGATVLCSAFHAEILDEVSVKPRRDRVKEQQATFDAAAKAKAKAKAKPKTEGRILREPVLIVDEIEERTVAEGETLPTWVWRRPCYLKCLSLMENEIRALATVEQLQPFGPKRAELTLLGTPVAAAILAKYADLSAAQRKAFVFPAPDRPAEVPGGPYDGWILRLV
eukprot:TRINITY_DN68920_c0_g1_i1.p1 TRINITY_DN68920_c0_g1~~TRINITY_DN68920_c0_g1_i1.p1  ORF type:complete len:461 (-),score=76.55 TRINITY_DN68920_c0_g1_i1:209-1591(-)